MINLANSVLNKMIIHRVGNKYNNISSYYSDELSKIDDDSYALFFPSAFSFLEGEFELYDFWHNSKIDLNEMFSFSKEIFIDSTDFVGRSKDIASHLYEQTNAPNINGGDLAICLIEDIQFNEVTLDGIAIIKCESRVPYFNTSQKRQSYSSELFEGINLRKFDKACLILNSGSNFTVISFDKKESTNYWQRDFLSIVPVANEYNFTKDYLDICKEFVTEQLDQEYEVSKTDKIGYLNRSVDFFKHNEQFDEQAFVKQVFGDKDVIKSFKNYKEDYVSERGLELSDEFDISTAAVKKQSRIFKRVLKLDKNFDIHIHGHSELIEKGYDSKVGKSYYKIYFDEET